MLVCLSSPAIVWAQTDDPAEQAMNAIRPEVIRAGIRFLSDDALEGRGTGTRGYDIAAKYMASQFESLGLQPAGDNGTYFQAVPLRSSKPDETKTVLTLMHAGKPADAAAGDRSNTFILRACWLWWEGVSEPG